MRKIILQHKMTQNVALILYHGKLAKVEVVSTPKRAISEPLMVKL